MDKKFEAIDENGVKVEFTLVETFGMNDSEYAVLESNDSEDLYILKMKFDKNGDMTLEGIDDEELEDAIEVYEELKSGGNKYDRKRT